MRLRALKEAKSGSFVGVKLTTESNARLTGWLDQNLIKNAQPPDKLHVTLVIDKTRKIPHEPAIYSPAWKIDPSTYHIDIFGPDKDIMVLRFDCPALEKRHLMLRKKYGLDWDFDEYAPHITLTKEVQEIGTELEPPNFEIELDREYLEAFGDAPD